jgi:ribosomal protein S18 acetylase RimI-like enzyme
MALSGIALAGMSSPPTAAVMRSIWQRHSSPADVSRFQALESMITQTCVVASPALAGFLAEGSFRVAAPLLASSCSCTGGALTWIWSRPHMKTAASATSDATRRGRVPGRLLAIFAIICASAMISGYFNISMAARFASGAKFPDTAGTVIAGAAIGSIAGGFLFARFWRWPGTRWGYPVLMSAWTLALWLLAATGHGYAVLAVAFASGLPVTGIGAEEFGMLGRLAFARSAWWFGLANTAISIGVGAGAAVGAQLVRFTDSGRFLPGIAATAVLAVSAVLWPALPAPKSTTLPHRIPEDSRQMEEFRMVLREIPAEQIGMVKDLWLELAGHHWRHAQRIAALASPVTPAVSWSMRRAQYESWASEPGWLLLGAELDGRLVGYAASRVVPVASSWDFGARMGKLETLVIQPGMRGRGTGRQLFDAVRRHWRALGVDYGSVSVMAENSDAVRFYEGLGAVEHSRIFYYPALRPKAPGRPSGRGGCRAAARTCRTGPPRRSPGPGSRWSPRR